MKDDSTGVLIRIDQEQLRGHTDEAVRSSVEETLTALLEAEAESARPGAAL